MTASADATARVWDVPTFSTADALALADLAEATSGYRVAAAGVLELISPDERVTRIDRLLEVAAQPQDDLASASSFLRWYFAMPGDAPISPQSGMMVETYLERLLALGDRSALREGEDAFPIHPLLEPSVPAEEVLAEVLGGTDP